MRTILNGFACMLFVIGRLASAANEDLKAELLKKQQQLANLTSQIDQAADAEFQIQRDVDLRLTTPVLINWGLGFSTPNFTITAAATSVSGDLVYQPGVYKVSLHNPADTKAYVEFTPFQIGFAVGTMNLTTTLLAHAETRVFIDALGGETNVFCQTNPNLNSTVRATFQIQTATFGMVPYSIQLIQPINLVGYAACYLGNFGTLSIPVPMSNLADEVGRGEFDLGYTNTLVIEIPTSPVKNIVLNLASKDPQLTIDANALEATADLDVSGP